MTRVDAIGVIEVQYFTNALELLDAMTKAADVQYLTSEKLLGGRMVTIIVGGSISQAQAAIEAARGAAAGKTPNPLKMSLVISKPHEEIMKFIVPQMKQEQQSKTESDPLGELVLPLEKVPSAQVEVSSEEQSPPQTTTAPPKRTRRTKQVIINPHSTDK